MSLIAKAVVPVVPPGAGQFMRRIGQAWENWTVLTGKRVPYEGLLTILARRRRIAGIHFAEIWFFEENEIDTLGGKRVAYSCK